MPDTCALIPLSAVCAFFLGLLAAFLAAVCKDQCDIWVARDKLANVEQHLGPVIKYREILDGHKAKPFHRRLAAFFYIAHESRQFIINIENHQLTCAERITCVYNMAVDWCRSWWPRNDQNKSVEIKTPTTTV